MKNERERCKDKITRSIFNTEISEGTMSDTYLTSPISLDDFRHWKWLQVNNLRISYDENSHTSNFFDETFSLWHRTISDELKDNKVIMVYVKSGYVMGFRVGGQGINYKIIDVIKKHFNNEVESVNYILERYDEL